MHLLTAGFVRGADEPIHTLGPAIKAFRLEAARLRAALVRPLPLANLRNEEARRIWANLARRGARWPELKRKLHRLQQLGPLPAFRIASAAATIEVLPSALTIQSADYPALRGLQSLFAKEARDESYGPLSLIALAPASRERRAKAGRQKSAPVA